MSLIKKTVGEEQYLKKVAKGDRDAFEFLFLKYRDRLFRFVWPLLKSESDIEDVIHEVFLVVWRQAGSFKGASKVSTWIFGIAYKIAMRVQQNKNRYHLVEPSDEALDQQISVNLPSSIEQRQMADWLNKGIAKLSPDHRIVIELTYYSGFSYKEIAEILGCPENTIKTRMFHARKLLRLSLPDLVGEGESLEKGGVI